MDEYLQQGVAANIKDSLFGKMASGISYVFNAIKSNFVTVPTKQEESKKVVVDLVKLVQNNALKVKGCAQHKSIELVMNELEALDKQCCGGNLTIADALTALVKRRCNNETKGVAFTLLTGLQCDLNEQQETCYSDPVTPCNEYTNQEDNHIYENTKYGLRVVESDHVLHTPDFEQQICNTDTSSEQCEDHYLHKDWDCITVEDDEESGEDECSKGRMFYFGPGKVFGSVFGKLIALALPIFIIANVIPGSYSATASSRMGMSNITMGMSNVVGMINIHNAAEFSMIGRDSQYPANSNYQLMNSFDAINFTQSIGFFSGNINGNNNTIYNLPTCLINSLEGNGTVENLTLSNANISSQECNSVVAKVIKDNALVRLVDIKSGYLYVKDEKSARHEHMTSTSSRIRFMGTVAEEMAGSSRIEQVTIIDVKIDCNLNADIKYSGLVNSFIGGGVVGEILHDSVMRDIVVMNVSINSAGSEVVYKVMIGGAAGYMEGATTIDNVVFIDTNIISGQAFTYLGGVVGCFGPYDGSISNIVSINTHLSSYESNVQRIAWGAGMVGLASVDMHHNLIINGAIKVETATCKSISIGAIIGEGFSVPGRSSARFFQSNDNIIINSNIELIGIVDPSHRKAIGMCTGSSDYFLKNNCLMANNVDFSVTSIGSKLSYSYKKTSNLVGQCWWGRLSFISGKCNVDSSEFMAFKQRIRAINVYKAFTDTPYSVSVSVVGPVTVGVVSVGAIIAGGCYCRKRFNSSLKRLNSHYYVANKLDAEAVPGIIEDMSLISTRNEEDTQDSDNTQEIDNMKESDKILDQDLYP